MNDEQRAEYCLNIIKTVFPSAAIWKECLGIYPVVNTLTGRLVDIVSTSDEKWAIRIKDWDLDTEQGYPFITEVCFQTWDRDLSNFENVLKTYHNHLTGLVECTSRALDELNTGLNKD